MTTQKSVIIIGGGIGGLGSAALFAKRGYQVTLLEKNDQLGGRAGTFEADGYRFDTGPSWYLMPDVFAHFFELLGEDVNKCLNLVRLSPSYRVFFKDRDKTVDIYSDLARDIPTFESLEPGSGPRLRDYLHNAERTYDVAINKFLRKNYNSIFDFLAPEMLTASRQIPLFSKMNGYVGRYFKTTELQQIMQYPLVFLGSSPYNAPALYNLMSHIDFNQGVYYPQGGVYKIIEALAELATKFGAELRTNAPVRRILTQAGQATGVELDDGTQLLADVIISNADIHHTETRLLEEADRSHSRRYWDKRVLAPSALLMYLGVDGPVPSLAHHNLLFSANWQKNFAQIFDNPQWPDDPSLYVCAPGKTDPTVAPKGKENLFVLVPVAAGLAKTPAELELYADQILGLIGEYMDIPDLAKRIEYRRLFAVQDFETRFNSLGGSALGLAHTLGQTAVFRPNNRSRKLKNLFYVGAGTHPGIGMPVCLISAELALERVEKLK